MTRRLQRCWFLVPCLATLLVLALKADSIRAQTSPTQTQVYVLGVSDVVSIAVWKNPELSTTVPVRPDGKVSVPLVGEVDVAGKTPAAFQEELTQKFARFVTAPGVSVVVTEIHSRRVYVMGEVGQSGAYDIFQPTRLMQILALAGGLTEYAKKDEVVILRGQTRLVASIKAISSGRRLADNLLLQPGDTVVVP